MSTVHPNRAAAPPSRDELAESVLAGLRQSPREISPVWFYDEYGSELFDRICELPEYYLTRTETAIMRSYAPEMAQHIGANAAIIELGSGSSTKTRLLLDHIQMPAVYVPVDISQEHMLDAAGALARDYPELTIRPVNADFTRPFALPRAVHSTSRRVVYFPGSTIGNFEPDAARALLASIRTIIGRTGQLLIGVDLRKDRAVLERAYNDAAGVTAQFNLNALRHINREIGANFDLSGFEHRAIWNDAKGRIEMYLISKRAQTVKIAGERVCFSAGEAITTEYSHKHTLESFAALAREADLSICKVWMDEQRNFSVQLARPA